MVLAYARLVFFLSREPFFNLSMSESFICSAESSRLTHPSTTSPSANPLASSLSCRKQPPKKSLTLVKCPVSALKESKRETKCWSWDSEKRLI